MFLFVVFLFSANKVICLP